MEKGLLKMKSYGKIALKLKVLARHIVLLKKMTIKLMQAENKDYQLLRINKSK